MNMKRIFTIISRAFLAIVAFSVVSCTPEAQEQVKVEPVFPEAVSQTINPGDDFTFTVEANLPCEISIPSEKLSYFWLDDNGIPESKLKLPAGTHTIKVQTAASTFFENAPVCDVTMTMESQSKVIATITLATAQRLFSVYPCKVKENGDFLKENGAYVYEETPSDALKMGLIWGANFELPIKVEANFDWNVVYPEWIMATVATSGKAGSTEILVVTDEKTFPTEGVTADITVKAGDTAIDDFKFSLSLEDTRNIAEISGKTEYTFDKIGKYIDMNGDEVDFYVVNFKATKGYRVMAVENLGSWYDTKEADWITLTPEVQWDEAGARIQTMTFKITVSDNESGAKREAAIFFLPESVAAATGFKLDDLFSGDGTKVKEEYEQYMATLSQGAASDDDEGEYPISYASGSSSMFEVLPTGDPTRTWISYFMSKWGVDRLYSLTFNSASSSAMLEYTRLEECYNYKYYDFETELEMEDPWISAEQSSDLLKVYMRAGQRSEGFLHLMDKDGKVMDVIYCLYDPDAEILTEPVFAFQYPQLVSGATLEVCPDDLWNNEVAGQEFYGLTQDNCYLLTYTSASPSNAMLVGPGGEPAFGEAWNYSKWLTYEMMDADVMYIDMKESGKIDFFVWKSADGYSFQYVLVCKAEY